MNKMNIRSTDIREEVGESTWNLTWTRFKKNRLAMAGLVIVILVCIVPLLAPFITPFSPLEHDRPNRLKPPSFEHFFGTDEFGRDIFSRVVYGTRTALIIGVMVVMISAVIGVTLGLISGYSGGLVDELVMRGVDSVWSFPALILALGIVVILGPGITNVMIAIALVGWASYARIVRGDTLSKKEELYIEAARAIGEKKSKIILAYIFPNVLSSILVLATYDIPSAIITASSLSFLGLGAQPPTPDWGLMLSQGRTYITLAPWYCIFPGLAIMFTVLGFNFVGDGLRDALQPARE